MKTITLFESGDKIRLIRNKSTTGTVLSHVISERNNLIYWKDNRDLHCWESPENFELIPDDLEIYWDLSVERADGVNTKRYAHGKVVQDDNGLWEIDWENKNLPWEAERTHYRYATEELAVAALKRAYSEHYLRITKEEWDAYEPETKRDFHVEIYLLEPDDRPGWTLNLHITGEGGEEVWKELAQSIQDVIS